MVKVSSLYDRAMQTRAEAAPPLGSVHANVALVADRVVGPTSLLSSLRTLLRYGLAGGTTQAIYLSVLVVLLRQDLHYAVCLTAAQVVAITFAFPVYRRHVFRAFGPIRRQLLTFLSVWWTGAAISLVGVPFLVEIWGLEPFVAQLFALVPVFFLSFAGHLKLSFRGPRRAPTDDELLLEDVSERSCESRRLDGPVRPADREGDARPMHPVG